MIPVYFCSVYFLKICFTYFFQNYDKLSHVPGISGMFQNVPECFGMFHVPDFIDGRSLLRTDNVQEQISIFTRHIQRALVE